MTHRGSRPTDEPADDDDGAKWEKHTRRAAAISNLIRVAVPRRAAVCLPSSNIHQLPDGDDDDDCGDQAVPAIRLFRLPPPLLLIERDSVCPFACLPTMMLVCVCVCVLMRAARNRKRRTLAPQNMRAVSALVAPLSVPSQIQQQQLALHLNGRALLLVHTFFKRKRRLKRTNSWSLLLLPLPLALHLHLLCLCLC